MIRVRDSTGDTHTVEADREQAVEILDEKGALAVVVIQGANGSVAILTPDDPVFIAYRKTHQLKAANVVIHQTAG